MDVGCATTIPNTVPLAAFCGAMLLARILLTRPAHPATEWRQRHRNHQTRASAKRRISRTIQFSHSNRSPKEVPSYNSLSALP